MTATARPMVIGVDPGPIPGIAVIRPDGQAESLQVTAGVVESVLEALIASASLSAKGYACLVAIEKYVVSGRSGRATSAGANAQTRNMVGALESLALDMRVPVRLRPAADVKTWATAGSPSRVERAGLAPTGMTHARSAGWHALYAAVHDTGFPDPLSRRNGRPQAAEDPR